jgi:ABC-type antimicrobial peptide transport system permease subunit
MNFDGPVDQAFFMNRIPSGYANPVTLLFRAKSPSAAADVQTALQSAIPEMPVALPAPLSGRIDRRLAQQRLFAQVLGLFSTLATLLAAVGLFGVVSFAVAQRRRELGIRIALGADSKRVRALVLRSAVGILVFGLAGGLAAALAMSKLIGALLFGVAPADPWSYATAAGLMAAVALMACWIPTRDAIRTDPVEALKRE